MHAHPPIAHMPTCTYTQTCTHGVLYCQKGIKFIVTNSACQITFTITHAYTARHACTIPTLK